MLQVIPKNCREIQIILKKRLSNHFTIDQRKSEHEFIIDLEEFREYNITDVDIAKRL